MADPRSVVVTGASRGLGRATAAHLHRAGWTVLAAMRNPDRDLEGLRADAGAADGDPRLIPIRLDLDDRSSVAAAACKIIECVGPPDGVVHNAGVAGVGSIEEMPLEVWEQIFSTNLFGPVRLTKALLPSMRAAGRGRIVLVSSQGAVRGMPAIGAYSAAKGALERWGESLAHEIAPFGLGRVGDHHRHVQDGHPRADHHLGGHQRSLRANAPRPAPHRGPHHAHRPSAEDVRPSRREGVGRRRAVPATRRRHRRPAPAYGSRLLPGRLLQRITGTAMGIPGRAPSRRPPPPRQRLPRHRVMTPRSMGAPMGFHCDVGATGLEGRPSSPYARVEGTGLALFLVEALRVPDLRLLERPRAGDRGR